MEYAYPPTSPLRPVSVDYASLGLIALCGLTAVALILYCRHPKQWWLITPLLVLPLLGATLLPFVHRSNPGLPADYRAFSVMLLLSGIGLATALVRGVGWRGALIIIVIGGFFVLLAPSKRRAGGVARRVQCMNHLRNVMVAVQNYATVNDGRMPGPGYKHDDLSWRVQILPLMDYAALFRAYHRDQPWDDPANEEFARIRIPMYQCPENLNQQDIHGRYYTAYAYFTGPGTAFDGNNTVTLDDISEADGLTSTIVIGEACGTNIVWNEPRDIDVGTQPAGVNLPGKTPGTSQGWLSSYHLDTVNVAFADGSVRAISKDIDPKVLKALTTVDGDDTPPKSAW